MARYSAFDSFADEVCIVGEADFADDVAVEKNLTVCGDLTVDGEATVGDRPILPPLSGTGAPDGARTGGMGQIYVDASSGRAYLCVRTDKEDGCAWKELLLA